MKKLMCARCNVKKYINEFDVRKDCTRGRCYHCKKCQSVYNSMWAKKHRNRRNAYMRGYRVRNKKTILRKELTRRVVKFGIRLKDYDAMFVEQKKRCAVCLAKSKRWLCVDHNHKTGKVRGLLCMKCNLVVGNAFESVRILQNAINYLVKHGGI